MGLSARAIRELIINAYAHRDWTRQNTVEVTVYSDRMEIISPGALPNGITVEKIKAGERTPRNNKIINIFRDYGLMESQGMGIRRKVIPLMREENGCEPIFEAAEDYFKVSCQNENTIVPPIKIRTISKHMKITKSSFIILSVFGKRNSSSPVIVSLSPGQITPAKQRCCKPLPLGV